MEKNRSLIAYCGLYCGACSFKLTYEERQREHLNAMLTVLQNTHAEWCDEQRNEPIEEFLCYGCRDERSTDKDGCSIYRCVKNKGLAHCGVCDEFPCAEIVSTDNDTQPHHTGIIENLKMLRELGEKQWLRIQEQRWTCECEAKRSWYLTTCLNCLKPIDHPR